MITCLPFLIALILYSGLILINSFHMLTDKYNRGNCTKYSKYSHIDCELSTLRKQSYTSSIITCIVIISVTYFLCKYKHEKIAWVVILTPVIMSLILFFVLIYKIKNLSLKDLKELKDDMKNMKDVNCDDYYDQPV